MNLKNKKHYLKSWIIILSILAIIYFMNGKSIKNILWATVPGAIIFGTIIWALRDAFRDPWD